MRALRRRLEQMSRRIEALEERQGHLGQPAAPARPPATAVEPSPEAPAPPVQPEPATPHPEARQPSATPPPTETAVPTPSLTPTRPATPPAAGGPRREWWSRLEARAGRRWLVWTGVILLFLSAGFFVKLAVDNQWVGPTVQVLAAALFGAGMTAAGTLLGRRMPALAQGLIGGGIAILYAAIWAAFGYYTLITQGAAFAFMVLVTGAAMTMAVLRNAPPISVLALLGGMVTPVLVGLGSLPRGVLFAYLLLLDLGTFTVGALRRWRVLDLLACIGTWTLFSIWRAGAGSIPDSAPVLLWIDAFFLLFLAAAFVSHYRPATPITAERFGLQLANAAFAVSYSWVILYPARPRVLGLQLLALAVLCFTAGAVWRRRTPGDGKSPLFLFTLAVALLTAAVALELRPGGITVLWALEAPLVILLSLRFRYAPGRLLGALVLALAVGRVFQAHWPLHSGGFTPVLNSAFGAVLVVCGAALLVPVLFRRIHHDSRAADPAISLSAGIAGGFLLLLLLASEITQALQAAGLPLLGRALAVYLWAAGGMAFLGAGIGAQSSVTRAAGMAGLTVALVLAGTRYPGIGASLFAAAAWAGYGLALRVSGTRGWEKLTAAAAIAIAILAGAALTSYEIRLLCVRSLGPVQQAWWLARLGSTAAWSLASAGCLAAGIRVRSVLMRLAGYGALIAAGALATSLQLFPVPSSYPLFLNARFGVSLMVVLAGFLAPVAAKRGQALGAGKGAGVAERRAASAIAWSMVLGLFLLISVEVAAGFQRQIIDPQRARWSSQAALSIAWVLYAAGMLAYGFWRRMQALRLAAIGLFAAAAVKVVLIDMATVGQVYRIVSGLAAGVAILGAAYLYHRLEKRLAGRGAPGPPVH